MSTSSTHVLDAALGRPAADLHITLARGETLVEAQSTDADGRIRWTGDLPAGTYTLAFDTGTYFARTERETFYPTVRLDVEFVATQPHYHVALLLSPFSYTTYRGS